MTAPPASADDAYDSDDLIAAVCGRGYDAAAEPNLEQAAKILEQAPHLATANIFVAVALGESETLGKLLDSDPEAATRPGGHSDYHCINHSGRTRVLMIAGLTCARTVTPNGPRAVGTLERVVFGGVAQSLLIRGSDVEHPVLLYLHGGPGTPFSLFAHHFGDLLERRFIVVHWDQRGAGRSNAPGSYDDMTLERFLSDTLEVVEHLRQRFNKRKIYLLGHSWGSVLGVLTVRRKPDLFHAYVGMGQVVHKQRHEAISYRYVCEQAELRGHTKAIRELRLIAPPYRSADDFLRQRHWLTVFGGDFHHGWGILPYLGRALRASEYTAIEKLLYVRRVKRSLRETFGVSQDVNFLASDHVFDTPVVFLAGRHDYNTPFELVAEYVHKIEAPSKQLIWFERSGHNPCLEEPDRFQRVLINALLEE